jgi:hypothetical protein
MTSNINGFNIDANQDSIFVGDFVLAPAEAEVVTNLISIAGAMHNLPALPPNISSQGNAFTIDFSEDGTLCLSKLGSPQIVNFEFSQTSDLIEAINEGVKISIDNKMLSPQPRQTGIDFSSLPSDDVY